MVSWGVVPIEKMFSPLLKQEDFPHVADFYNGKSVFITGAAGYVGEVILEILLRCCPGIQSVYILLREKKGKSPEDRREVLFKRKLFDKLKLEQPDALGKVYVLAGDVSLQDLGMNQEDFLKVVSEVSIVFHCAADISFEKPVRHLLFQNAQGTNNVVELCKSIKNLEALVYTSTICSNTNHKTEIREEIYRLPFPAQKLLDELKNGSDESLQKLIAECHPSWPNPYSFSKYVAENILQDNAKGLPVAIIRPSVVISVWKEPVPGYSERNSAMQLLGVGVGKGFIKVILVDPDMEVEMVPVDVVANSHLVSAWRVATGRSSSPFVVNCTSYGIVSCTWRQMASDLMNMAVIYPLPGTFRKVTSVSLQKNIVLYRVQTFLYHYIPAYVLDGLLKLAGKKPRLVSMYRLYDKAMHSTYFFTTANWKYEMDNFKLLEKDLDANDKKTFYTDMSSIDTKQMADDVGTGSPDFDWGKDKRPVHERMKIANQRHILTVSIQGAVLLLVCSVLYFVISQVLQIARFI